MEKKLLLPNQFKVAGWILILLSSALWIYLAATGISFSFLNTKTFALVGGELFQKKHYFSWVETNLSYTLIGSIFIIGGLFTAFAREKVEDEFIMKLRLASLQWAVLLNYALLLLMFLFVYGVDFLAVMMYNMFTVLILFILRFQYMLSKNKA